MSGSMVVPAGFVGREVELSALEEARDAVRAGQPRTVIVEGPAGIGKTSLIRRAISTAAEMPVLDASGAEWERSLSWGIVEQLVRGGARPGVQLPPALVAPYADAPTVGAGLVELLGTSSRERPVVLLIDDAHWADVASLQAVTFALRRLRHDPVLAVFATRIEGRERVPDGLWRLAEGPRGALLALAGLPPDDLAALAGEFGVRLSGLTAAQLAEHTSGNPLHARGLLGELDPEQLEGLHEVPLPAPRSFTELVSARMARCPPNSVGLAAAAAVLGSKCPVVLAGELAAIEDPAAALDPLVEAGLVATRRLGAALEVCFAHALVRAAVYHALRPAQAARLHRRAATLLDDERLALQHRAAAVPGQDEDLADLTEAFAWRQRTRGAWASAAEAFARAARLTADPGRRERRLMEAADAALLAGDATTVQYLVEQLDPEGDSAHRRYVMARIALVTAPWEQVRQLADLAWEICDPTVAPDLAARIANLAAMLAVNDGRAEESLAWSRHALVLSETPPPDARWAQLLALSALGRSEEVAAVTAAIPDTMEDLPRGQTDIVVARGMLRLWDGDLPQAISDLSAAHRTCARRGPFHTGHVALFYLADAQYRAGDWDGAIASAEVAVSATEDADQPWFAPFVHAAAAFPLAGRGDVDAAAAHVEAALAGARARGDMAALSAPT
jgi:hypothetical protein